MYIRIKSIAFLIPMLTPKQTSALLLIALEKDMSELIVEFFDMNSMQIFNYINDSRQSIIEERAKRDNNDGYLHENETCCKYLDFPEKFQTLISLKSNNESVLMFLRNNRNYLDKLYKIRNNIFHGREVEPDEIPQFLTFIYQALRENKDTLKNTNQTSFLINKGAINQVNKLTDYLKPWEKNLIPNNIPLIDYFETGFIGRNSEIKTIKKYLKGNTNVISIIGQGGAGKTALALFIADEIINNSEDYKFDAVIWTSAKNSKLDWNGVKEIKNGIVDTEEIKRIIYNEIDNSMGENEDLYLNYLKLFNFLIIIDNLETLDQHSIKNFILDTSEHCKIIITSRIGIGEGERIVRIGGFTEDEALSHFIKLSKARNNKLLLELPKDTKESYVKKLNYLPLAIKWFVNCVDNGRSPDEIFNNQNSLLKFCFDNIYDKLSDNSKQVLNVLRIKSSGLSEADIYFLLEIDIDEIRIAILELTRSSFIEQKMTTQGTYQIIINDFTLDYLRNTYTIDTYFRNQIYLKSSQLEKKIKSIMVNNSRNTDPNILDEVADNNIAAIYLDKALKASKREHFTDALQFVEQATSINRTYYEVYRVKAFIADAMGEYELAQESYEKAIDLKPNSEKLVYHYGKHLSNRNDIVNLSRILNLIDEKDISIYNIYLLRSNVIISESGYEEAIKYLDQKRDIMINGDAFDLKNYFQKRFDIYYLQAKQEFKARCNFKLIKELLTRALNELNELIMRDLIDNKITGRLESLFLSFISPDIIINLSKDEKKNIRELTNKYLFYSSNYNVITLKLEKNINQKRITGNITYIHGRQDFFFINNEFYASVRQIMNITSNVEKYVIGQKVSFILGSNSKGPCAIDILFED